jgi:hypothetical protein
MWLECPVEETDDKGRTRGTTEARDTSRGIPQGSPISPLLANIYMRRFVLGWKKLGRSKYDKLGGDTMPVASWPLALLACSMAVAASAPEE